ncbi:uncharacterized protein PFL1_02445 [Pseudozyma flocculosa PF-1]|uniref:Related to THI21 - Hydroxymethylpyrimidine phosphate kinase, involved in the last steps in thiamine biosynthesis n=2 Tax=Pseudozyma flocculosa TaxID=84751 RepID=A0A5C3F0T3_9BASI|nr:uncharacterized protein PFL1_02445 [Pseudozyma flocculosa PF-1]EPQ29772.1 hypothetical protein PFL1_02445 [Pseudozyma flocculosa PF-1]SPO37059.1 related to THI21 - Hydroxymethylpyrimidine phosphate kinase, involved in the last steps in thiamine biosynthesis [Pseudozyma flocculosa]
MSPPRVLTIAGSDSGGGAGIQADLKTFLSLGTYGLSVLTALTAQSTTGVSAIHAPPASFVVDQLHAVTRDIRIDAVKLGMLCNHDILVALAHALASWKQQPRNASSPLGGHGVPIVLDPVMVSTSGSLLLSDSAVVSLIQHLLPLCTLLTPNLPEAKQLLRYANRAPTSGAAPSAPTGDQNDTGTGSASDAYHLEHSTDIPAMVQAANELAGLGPSAVLVKGGHAKLGRGQVLAQIAQLTAGRDQRPIAPLEQRPTSSRPDLADRTAERVSAIGGTSRSALGNGSDHEDDGRRQQDLAALAGLHGATITQSGNITVVRTDEFPYADILRNPPPPSQQPAFDGGDTADDDEQQVICDVLFERGGADGEGSYTLFVKPFVSSTATHGTGCTLSSAVAASLAQGHSLLRSVSIGIDYVQRAIACGIEDLGQGSGPLDHGFPIQARSLPRATRQAPHPLTLHLVSNSLPLWAAFTRSPFVLGIADRSIPLEAFVYFLRQDYVFLRHYARLWSLAATFAANSFEQIATFARISLSMVHEAEMHVGLCARFGVDKDDLEHGTVESQATLAYTRFVEGVGRSGGILDLIVALAPCLYGYGEVGLFLGRGEDERRRSRRRTGTEGGDGAGIKADGGDDREEGLQTWIQGYAGDEFQQAVRDGMALLEDIASQDPPSAVRLEKLQKIWDASCRLEIAMWDEAMRTEVRRGILDP